MPTTPKYGLPSPSLSDSPHVPYWTGQLAAAVESAMQTIDAHLDTVEAKADAPLTPATSEQISDEVITQLTTPGTPPRNTLEAEIASRVGDYSLEASAPDVYAVQRLDRTNAAAAARSGGQASIAYADAVELTESWANLTAWQAAANAQVSGNRLYALNANNPGGVLRSFPVAANENAHITTLIYWKAGGASNPVYVGIDLGTPNHAPAASSPEGLFIGFAGTGLHSTFRGGSVLSIPNPVITNLGAASPSGDATYAVSIDVQTLYVSFTIRNIANPADVSYAKVLRSTITDAGKAINNIAVFMQDARGTGGHAVGPVVAVKTLQPARTKTLAAQAVEAVSPRLMVAAASPAGSAWRIQLPKSYDPRTPSPVVVWCHQSLSGTADTPWSEARTRPLTQALADAGYIVASSADGGDRWGNATSVAEYLDLYKRVRDTYHTGPVYLIGVSMGGLSALNALSHREWPTPAAAVLIGGVCNLDDLWANPSYDDGIAAAYGLSGPDAPQEEYDAATAGFNPLDRDGWEFRGVPVRFYTSAGDTSVPKATGCDLLLSKMLPYSPGSSVVVKAGGHLDASQYPPAEVVEFFDAYRR